MTARVSTPVPVAIILAAGRGVRLQSVHAARPKGFVEVGGDALIRRSLRLLRAAGVGEFVFVTGWKGACYREWCACEAPGARCVDNGDYATTGSLRSLLTGATAAPGRDLLVVESDLLFERRAPAAVLLAPSSDAVLVSGVTGSGDEVWAYADARGCLRHLSKRARPGETAAGELVGLSRLSAGLVAAVAARAAALPPAAHYEDGLNAVAADHPITLVRVTDLAWCEIDDPGQLERARNLVWPRIAAADALNPALR